MLESNDMRILVPHFILGKHKAGETRGVFPSAAIFVDLSGFSTMADELARHGQYGAEALADLVRVAFEPLINAVYEQGGFVIGYAGDAFTAVFPEEQNLEAGLMRCLSAAVTMQNRVRSNPSLKSPFGVFPIFIKAGIGFGETKWQIFKSKDGAHATFWFRGESLAGAVEAEELAAPGGIVLCRSAYEAMKDVVDAVQVENCFQLAGMKMMPVPALPLPDLEPDLVLTNVFFPETISQLPFVGEFRHVVNLFVDIPINISDETLIAPFMETVYALQEKYDGFFLRPDLGDKGFNLLMFWGAPTTHENDVERALNFLLELGERTRLDLRAGVSYRVAYAGFMGSSLREDYTSYGWGVNLASRLMEHAPAGSFWLDEESARRAEKHFHVEYLGEYKFKGFAKPQKTFALRGRKQLAETVYHGKLLGRSRELELLADFVKPLKEGKFAGIMSVKGDAGMGKSRLVHTFQASDFFRDFNAQWIVCQTNEILRSSYNPFLDLLRRKFDLQDGQPDEINWERFSLNLELLIERTSDDELVGELRRTSSVLAALVNINLPGSLYERLNARDRYDNTQVALSAFLRAESLQRPLILFIEDTHWLDEDSAAFLSYFVRTLLADPGKQYPIAIIATQRLEGDAVKLMDDVSMYEIRLGKLPSASVSALAENILGKPIAKSFAKLLYERAEGNPFFIEQLVRYLQEQNALKVRQNIYQADEAALVSLPTDVQAVLVARLDQLNQRVRDTVQTAAVLGREFELRLLAQILRDTELNVHVKMAEEANIWAPLNEREYFFRHALLRDAAYSMQLASRQRTLHAQALQAMEILYQDDLETHYGELAYHAERAEITEKALYYLTLAADFASKNYQNAQAVDYYTRILALTPPDDLRARFGLIYKRLEIYEHVGNRSMQEQDLARLEEIASQLEDSLLLGRVWMKRAYYFNIIADYPNAIAFAERALELAQPLNDTDTVFKIYVVLPSAFLRTGKLDEAVKRAQEALAYARQLGDRSSEASALSSLGLTMLEKAGPDVAFQYHKQALELAVELGDRYLEANTLNNIANAIGLSRGDYFTAFEYFERARVIFQELGNFRQGMIYNNLGWATAALGDYDLAEKYYYKSLAQTREAGGRSDESYTLVNLSAVAIGRGDPAIALEWAERALALSRKLGDITIEAWAYFYMGYAHLLTADYSRAREMFARAVHIREEINVPVLVAEARAGLAAACLRENDMEAAAAELEKVLLYMWENENFSGAEEPLRIYYECYLILKEKRDPRLLAVLQKAAQILQSQVSRLRSEEARQMFVQNVPWRRAIWNAARENGFNLDYGA
jgi:predicted ATPase/class 3 adenylate cyclase